MKVCIMTLGSRGDVQPYVAIARGLMDRGHSVSICTGRTFKDLIEENGVQFCEASLDLMALLNTEEGKEVFNNASKNILGAMQYAKRVVNPLYRKTLDDFYHSAEQADIIIYHPKALGAVDIAEYLRIPCISVSPVPMTYPITEFPNLAFSPVKSWGKFLNKLSYKVVKYADKANLKEINSFRKEVLHLPKRKAGIYAYKRGNKKIPIIYPISPLLFKDVKSWKDDVYLPGFCSLNTADLKLGSEIQEFLDRGQKPIVISFSSMPLKHPEAFQKKLIEALKVTHNRGIILTGVSGISATEDENILYVTEAPHNILFEQAKGIIHHGGVGTMAAALKSGVPQLIIPFSVDQPFWANRLYQLGYALRPLKEDLLCIEDLVAAFEEMDSDPIKERAKQVKAALSNEDGVKNTVDYIEKIRALEE